MMSTKSKKKETQSDDDFLEQCIKANEQCSLSTCSKSIKLIKLMCHLCSENFCTTHVLPEVHGCGTAARKESAGPPKKAAINQEKRENLESRLNMKLRQKKNERKRK